jgi:hypothetical protein
MSTKQTPPRPVVHLKLHTGNWVGASGRSGIETGGAIRPCRAVPAGAVGAFDPDLAGALEPRGIRVPGALALPEVEGSTGLR